jgi:hypothetical protein
MKIRLPGYYRALRRWYDAEPGSRAERFWMRARTVLSLGAVREEADRA